MKDKRTKRPPLPPRDPDLMTAAEVGAWLGMGRRQVYEAAHRRELPCLRTGRMVKFSRRRISALLHGPDEPTS